jgi:CDP-diacylglycerol--glycerol-3-phosphate 3-phosphatidyltransferase
LARRGRRRLRIASATDFVDGYIARRFELVTSFGKVADPIADKALTGSALLLLSAYGALPWWVTLLILVREWGITPCGSGAQIWRDPRQPGGKLKTVLQIAAIECCTVAVSGSVGPDRAGAHGAA